MWIPSGKKNVGHSREFDSTCSIHEDYSKLKEWLWRIRNRHMKLKGDECSCMRLADERSDWLVQGKDILTM